jgi:transcription elongation factor GreA
VQKYKTTIFFYKKEGDQMENEKEVLLTQEGYDNLEKELEYLTTEKRAEIAERIKIALGFGDLSENSEYDEAKNAQAANETKIAELENKLRYAKIIDESEIDTKTVQVGNTVKVLDMEFNEEESYTIVGSTEVDLAQNKISNESPIGEALMGAKKGQVVEAQAPAGVIKYKIISITK